MNIYDKIINKVGFCFVRINDGETNAIISSESFASRGDEKSSPELSNKLLNILTDRWYHDNLFIGIPCINCYHHCYSYVRNELIKSKPLDFIQNNTIDANILINSNYDQTLEILMENLKDRNIIIISNETIVSNLDRLSRLGINVSKSYTVSSKMAFSNDYNNLKDLEFEDNSFIITLCGPLGRVLSYEWFKKNQTLSCLDLGSFFDPLLRNKSYLYHTNNHKYCYNCYPKADNRFTNIFYYCTEYVDKECYYLGSIQDHLHLYNNDYNRIILNLKIRIEKEPYNYDLHAMLVYSKYCLYDITHKQDYNTYKKLVELCNYRNPKKVLEIGFGACILLLEYASCNVTCINNKEYNIDYIKDKYKDRFTFIQGNINDILLSVTNIYDLIYINLPNGNYNDILSSIVNCYHRSTKETILIVNGVVRKTKLQDKVDIVNAYDKCISEKLINSFYEEDYDYNSGMASAKYNWNNNFIRCNNLLSSYMNKTDYIISLIDTIKDNYNDLQIISTYVEELKLLKLKNTSNEGYAFQIPEQFVDMVNFCHCHDFCNILEIGFLHGCSSLLFLMNSKANVTSIDHNENKEAVEYLSKIYPNRFTFIHGTSEQILNDLIYKNESYDLIFIDGCHTYDMVKKDYNKCLYLSDNAFFIMNDVILDTNMFMFWNEGPTKVYKEINTNDKSNVEILSKVYSKGRGMVIFKPEVNLSDKKNILHMNKTDMYNEIISIINSKTNNTKLLTRLDILISTYLEYFSLVLNDDEINTISKYCNVNNIIPEINLEYISNLVNIPKIIHLIYLNQRPLKDFNYKCIKSIIKHMPEYQIYIHNDIEPDCDEWNELKKYSNISIKKINRIKEFDGFPISHVQYEADIHRMYLLYEYGGIYLDMDIFIIKDITPLLDGHSLYIAKETEDNFINCVLISEPKNEFIFIWLKYFATGLRMGIWGWHIRDLPKLLLNKFPNYYSKYNIKLLDYENFCPIHWTQSHILKDSNFKPTEKIYGIHLFETILGESLNDSIILSI